MLLVIFGAGASFDSYATSPPNSFPIVRLPLADQLFDRRFGKYYELFPKCQQLIVPLQKPQVNVEQVLEEYQSQTSQYPNRVTQLAAVRYYLSLMISRCQDDWTKQVTNGASNYKTLLDQIELQRIQAGQKVCLVSFNYDTLIEEALESIGVPLRTIDDYVAGNYKTIKLHGSTRWAHPIRNVKSQRSFSQELISDILDKIPSLDIDQETYDIVADDPFGRPPKPLFPALAIPVTSKQNYECPKSHKKVLEDCLPQVTKVLCIGWRATDALFLNTLSKHLNKKSTIMVVTGSEQGADEVVQRLSGGLRNSGFSGDITTFSKGFSNFMFSSEWNHFRLAES